MEAIYPYNQEQDTWQFPDLGVPGPYQLSDECIEYDDAFTQGTGREMNFNVKNATSYFAKDASKPFFKLKSNQHNLVLLPKRDMVVQWQPYEETETFTINLGSRFFFENIPAEHPLHGHFKNGIDSLSPAFMSIQNMLLTPGMVSTLYEILDCTYQGYHKSLFIKAKVIELLAQQFEQYEKSKSVRTSPGLREAEVEKMRVVQKLLTKHIERPLSLRDLAHQVGTNEFDLKKNFKLVYGTTVFGYLNQYRMERAKEMLSNPANKVAEVAHKLGFKHATHFTAAFKKYFGFLPNKIRVMVVYLLHLSQFAVESATEWAGADICL
jgi:AraC-like DNA-binding protein